MTPLVRGFEVTCLACHARLALAAAKTPDEARAALAAMGWDQRAQRGVGRNNWPWICPACNPMNGPPAKTMGRSTP